MLVNYLKKEIVLFDDRIEIHYNSPIIRTGPDEDNLEDTDARRGFLFYNGIMELGLNRIQIEMYAEYG